MRAHHNIDMRLYKVCVLQSRKEVYQKHNINKDRKTNVHGNKEKILERRFVMCKKSVNLIICLICLLSLSPVARATVYYVDSIGGDDGNLGTSPAEAWASLTPVNNTTLGPGDQVLLKAGTSYTGQLAPQGVGSDGSPIIIDMYDTGDKPRIDGEGSVTAALYLFNCAYYEISNLELTNQGAARSKNRWGVWTAAENYGDVRHQYLRDLYIHDVNGDLAKAQDDESAGIFIRTYGSNPQSRFDDLLIENCHLVRCDRNGIACWTNENSRDDGSYFPSINMVIRGNLLEDIGGDGIKAWSTDGCLIEYNTVDGCRMRCDGYAAGIWPFVSDNCVIQYNEVCNMKGTEDGMGFDSDYSCYNTTIQYNYSHDNEGGFLLVTAPRPKRGLHGVYHSVIRYNISQNDGTPGEGPIFTITGPGVHDTYIYNNTIYVPSELNIQMIRMGSWQGYADNTRWYNNIFYVEGSATYDLGDSTNNLFEANCFYGNHISPPSDPYAITSNPYLLDPGSGGFGMDSVDGYQLGGSSPCINAGRDTGIAYNHPDHINGGIDYWGNSLPEEPLQLDIGAHETSGEPSYCGDGTCDPGEDQCNCSDDCGNPPATETNCTDGINEDCDAYTDCADSDCDDDPACIGGGTLFSDDFESGDLVTNGWIKSGTALVLEEVAYTGVYGVKLQKYAYIEKAVSTEGKGGITVEYDRMTMKYDAGEGCLVEWYDGSDWNLIENTQDLSWGHASFELPSGADDNPHFRIRFTSNGNHTLEKTYLDNVEILY